MKITFTNLKSTLYFDANSPSKTCNYRESFIEWVREYLLSRIKVHCRKLVCWKTITSTRLTAITLNPQGFTSQFSWSLSAGALAASVPSSVLLFFLAPGVGGVFFCWNSFNFWKEKHHVMYWNHSTFKKCVLHGSIFSPRNLEKNHF